MSNFKKSINKYLTCEVYHHGNISYISYFAKLDNGNWVAVFDDGSLDWVEMTANDFNDMLESVESTGASIRFTNHSAV